MCVFAPAPLLTVTIESRHPDDELADEKGDTSDDGGELHLHVGGQGYWVARMLVVLGADVVLCATFGGETGAVARGLLEGEDLVVRVVEVDSANGAYVHDRRTGERQPVATTPSGRLSRHHIDDLFGVTLVEGLEAELCVLGGPDAQRVLPADTYRRLAADLSANGRRVVVDLSGDRLDAALEGGVTFAKVSHEELLHDGRARDDDVGSLVEAMRRLAGDGAGGVAVTRAEHPALALVGDRVVEIVGPAIVPADPKGAGDSFTAGLSAALAWGLDVEAALRIAVAAGSLNVSRHGLGSGNREHIVRLAEHVELRPVHP
ncbi:MAG: phosphofructokinase [Acidimicrobiia bacterium]|nr:phosphofructokinase [Acidimicrobiia bacterium]